MLLPVSSWDSAIRFSSESSSFVTLGDVSKTLVAVDFFQVSCHRFRHQFSPGSSHQQSLPHFGRIELHPVEHWDTFNFEACFFQQSESERLVGEHNLETWSLRQEMRDPDFVKLVVRQRDHGEPIALDPCLSES